MYCPEKIAVWGAEMSCTSRARFAIIRAKQHHLEIRLGNVWRKNSWTHAQEQPTKKRVKNSLSSTAIRGSDGGDKKEAAIALSLNMVGEIRQV
jgi:hypothetical protein